MVESAIVCTVEETLAKRMPRSIEGDSAEQEDGSAESALEVEGGQQLKGGIVKLKAEDQRSNHGGAQLTKDDKHAKQVELDSRSIFVSNITHEATAETLEEHFKDVGMIKRITILYNKRTGEPKGYAYIEFESIQSVDKALQLDGSTFNTNAIVVAKKRTNLPGFNRSYNYHHGNHTNAGNNDSGYLRQHNRHRVQRQQVFYSNQWQAPFPHPQWNFAAYGAYSQYKNVNFYNAYQYQQPSQHPKQRAPQRGDRIQQRGNRHSFRGSFRGNRRGAYNGGKSSCGASSEQMISKSEMSVQEIDLAENQVVNFSVGSPSSSLSENVSQQDKDDAKVTDLS